MRVDPLIRPACRTCCWRLRQHENKTIVFITHRPRRGSQLGDTIAILKRRPMVSAGGDPQKSLCTGPTNISRTSVQDINRARVIRARSVMEPVDAANGGNLQAEVTANDTLETVLAAMQGNPDGCVGVTQDGLMVGAITARRMLEVLPPQK